VILKALRRRAELDRANEVIERIGSAVDSLVIAAPQNADVARQQLATIAIREVRGYRMGDG
jgi:hypothetical protein